MKRYWLVVDLLAALLASVVAQPSEHQRTAVAGKDNLSCTLSCSTALYPMTTDLGPSLESDNGLGIDLTIKEKFGVSAFMPFIFTARFEKYGRNIYLFALGDPSLSLTATGRIGDWQVSAKLGYTYPLGIWNPYQVKKSALASGAGYHRIEGSIAALRYMDPLAAGFILGADRRFGKQHRFGYGVVPVSINLGVFATEALNSVAALSAGLHQRYSVAPKINGIPEDTAGEYSLAASASLLINRNRRSVSIGFSKSLSDLSSPAAFTMEAAFTFKKRDLQ
jgi:hypothetical protein